MKKKNLKLLKYSLNKGNRERFFRYNIILYLYFNKFNVFIIFII